MELYEFSKPDYRECIWCDQLQPCRSNGIILELTPPVEEFRCTICGGTFGVHGEYAMEGQPPILPSR